MCIICIKPMGVDMPSKEYRENMWMNNNDGAGLMWNTRNHVHIEKGFMKLQDLENRLSEIGDLTNKTVVLHYRITTHGGTKPENCHPFPISEHVGILQKPSINTDIGVAHNGIISAVTPGKNISDTMEYIVTQLSYAKRIDPLFYKKRLWRDMVENIIDSKMVFLDGGGDFETIGEFVEEEGCFYSNTSYLPRSYYSKYDLSCYGVPWDDEDTYEYKRAMDLASWEIACDGRSVIIDRETNMEIDHPFDFVWYLGTDGTVYQYDPEYDTCIAYENYVAYNADTMEKVKYQLGLAEYVCVEKWPI